MTKALSNFIFISIFGLLILGCANRGTPDGGPKDELPPEIVKSFPENYSTNFKGKDIKIVFNEYIKINDLKKQLIISPPMKTDPIITPLGGASKFITIKIKDTLLDNTTYAFNFGNSILDNNEGNPFPYYRYVLSTGSYIDSLRVTGQIVDALKKTPETFVNVGLYEIDSTFSDSIVYKQTPKYVTNTLDSVTTFSIDNVKSGKYMLVALKDKNGNNTFQQSTDQIGFYETFIEVPTKTDYTLRLFNEALDFKARRARLISGEKIVFGYNGDYTNMEIEIQSKTPKDFKYRITKDPKADSLYYWYTPRIKADSLLFKVSHKAYEKDFTVKISEQKRDTLVMDAQPKGSIGFEEDFKISGSIPFTNFDVSKATITKKDSTTVSFTTYLDTLANSYHIQFKKEEENNYKIKILPKAFTDFFGQTNTDTINYSLNTPKTSAFGYARFSFVNAKFPLIVQLTDQNGKVVVERNANDSSPIDFLNLNPGIYPIRVIHDTNGNKVYDTGNYLKKMQPEKVSHFKAIEIRADWGVTETLTFK